ncbi:MAG: sulfate permease [Calditrichaceae bacterium]|nr:sulfate permease [Calditrichia bacterium]NUQ41821.1 sulfate permease [Calditrichaceae bacterium]
MNIQPTKLEPKLITVFKEGYSRRLFFRDLAAGIIVGIVALPLSIALAIASGVKPEQGLYTAVIAGFLISVLGGSRFQIGGPTGAFIVIVYDVVQKYGYDGLAAATVMAGVLLVVMGFARLGAVIKFIPYPLTVGFTAGIALIILTSQIRDFLGLKMDSLPADFIEKLLAYSESLGSINLYALGIGLLSLLIILYWPKVTRRVPGSLAAILLATALVQWLHLPVETIGSRFGSVPNMLPAPRLPAISWELLRELSSPALAIALLAGIESLLSAVVADGMSGTRHRSNMELVAQGVANIASPIFGGIPATGAIARTATNLKNGGKTPVAGITHALTVLLIMLFFGKLAALIPMATLAAILIMVAYNMSEWHLFVKLFRSPKSDILVLLASFLLTVLIDLTVAIEVGIVLAAFLFMHRMATVTQTGYVTESLREEEEGDDPLALSKREVPEGVEVFEIYGPFFFGAADQFKDALRVVERIPKVLILRIRHVFAMDATALRALEDVYEKSRKDGTVLVLSGVHAQPLMALERSGLLERIGEENVHLNIDDALNRARAILGLPPVERPTPVVPTVAREKNPAAPASAGAKDGAEESAD